jgi:hypothetical protein
MRESLQALERKRAEILQKIASLGDLRRIADNDSGEVRKSGMLLQTTRSSRSWPALANHV